MTDFKENDTHPDLVPKVIRDVRVGDLVELVLRSETESNPQFNLASGYVSICGYMPSDKKYLIGLSISHPQSKGGAHSPVEIDAREVTRYRIHSSYDEIPELKGN